MLVGGCSLPALLLASSRQHYQTDIYPLATPPLRSRFVEIASFERGLALAKSEAVMTASSRRLVRLRVRLNHQPSHRSSSVLGPTPTDLHVGCASCVLACLFAVAAAARPPAPTYKISPV